MFKNLSMQVDMESLPTLSTYLTNACRYPNSFSSDKEAHWCQCELRQADRGHGSAFNSSWNLQPVKNAAACCVKVSGRYEVRDTFPALLDPALHLRKTRYDLISVEMEKKDREMKGNRFF